MGLFDKGGLLGHAVRKHSQNRRHAGLPTPPGAPRSSGGGRNYGAPAAGGVPFKGDPEGGADQGDGLANVSPDTGGPPQVGAAPPSPPAAYGRPGQFDATQTEWLGSLNEEDRAKEIAANTAARPRFGQPRQGPPAPPVIADETGQVPGGRTMGGDQPMPLPPWAMRRGVTPDAYAAFRQQNPQAPMGGVAPMLDQVVGGPPPPPPAAAAGMAVGAPEVGVQPAPSPGMAGVQPAPPPSDVRAAVPPGVQAPRRTASPPSGRPMGGQRPRNVVAQKRGRRARNY